MSKIKQNKEKLQSYQGDKRNPTVRLSKSGTKWGCRGKQGPDDILLHGSW